MIGTETAAATLVHPEHRRTLRLLLGTLQMLEGQVRSLPDDLRMEAGLPAPGDVADGRAQVAALLANTADAPIAAPERPKTMGVQP